MAEGALFEYPVLNHEAAANTTSTQSNYLYAWDGGLNAYLVLLGYVAAIWEQLGHPATGEQVKTFTGVTGQGVYNFAQEGTVPNCSGVLIEIVEFPPDTDMKFGRTRNIYVGQCAFITTPVVSDKRESVKSGNGTVGGVGIGANVAGGVTFTSNYNPWKWGSQYSTGMMPLVNGQEWGAQGPEFGISLSVDVGFNKSAGTYQHVKGGFKFEIGAASKAYEPVFFPIQWINFDRSYFVPTKPNATGFWWSLKDGVKANIYLYGTEVGVGARFSGAGEGGVGQFNPNNGGG